MAMSQPAVDGNYLVHNIKKKKSPQFEDYLNQRDYVGAITLLEFEHNTSEKGLDADLWLAYCAFHLGDYKRALKKYKAMIMKPECPSDVWIYLACTFFYLGLYKEAEEAALKAPQSQLQNRLLFHLAHKFKDDNMLMGFHCKMMNAIEDQMSLASLHYMRCHFQEAIHICKQILLENKDYLAIYLYLALCYYKMEYYEISQQLVANYLQRFPHSLIACNLDACILFRLYGGKAAAAKLRHFLDMSSNYESDTTWLIRHNLALFGGWETDMQVLPSLVDIIPEARLNLAICYLLQGEHPPLYYNLSVIWLLEYILKGVVNLVLGQKIKSRKHDQLFSCCGPDTTAGRQCLASSFFLQGQFMASLIYLSSIKIYFFNDDTFNFNYAQAKAAVGDYREAETAFLQIRSDDLKCDWVYLSWLARCYIMNSKANLAWDLYLRMETSANSYLLLQLIANDCYKMGQFFFAALAFDILERGNPIPLYWEGKRGACVGVFQLIIARQESSQMLKKVLCLLRGREHQHPEVAYIIKIMLKWANDNRMAL
uniref:Intraflagellar transport protein 56 n=1 Tax=Myripristis murdjan TaxID=586833 RepID=A0A667ZFR3_9TELE